MPAVVKGLLTAMVAVVWSLGTGSAQAQPVVGIKVTVPVSEPDLGQLGLTASAQWSFNLGSLGNGRLTGVADLSQTLRLADFDFHADPPVAPKARVGVQWTPRIGGAPISLGFYVGCSLADPKPRCSGDLGPIDFSGGSSSVGAFALRLNFDLGANVPPAAPDIPWVFDRIDYIIAAVPEPGRAAMAMAGVGALALWVAVRRKRDRGAPASVPATLA